MPKKEDNDKEIKKIESSLISSQESHRSSNGKYKYVPETSIIEGISYEEHEYQGSSGVGYFRIQRSLESGKKYFKITDFGSGFISTDWEEDMGNK